MGLVVAVIVSLSLVMSTPGIGQTGGTSIMRQSAIESLHDSQWVRLASPEIGRREGRLLARNPTELILSPAPDPVRIPAAEIDTIWTRGSSTKTGLLVGALLGAAPGRPLRNGPAPMEAQLPVRLWLAVLVLVLPLEAASAQSCREPYRVPREAIAQAMRAHGPYSLTSTTTSMLFGSRALLEIVRRRQREAPEDSQFTIDHADWFAAHLETAGVPYAGMSESARAGFEHRQDVLVDYGPRVVARVEEGPAPRTSLDITIFTSDSAAGPAEFGYKDTLSVPKVDVFNQRLVRFKMLEYDDMMVFDRVTGISVRPLGFLSALFTVVGKPDLKETRLATSDDYWQVVRGRVNVMLGISKTGTATIQPDGRGHEGVPRDRPDLAALAKRIRRPVELRYGPPSCQARMLMRRQGAVDCHRPMGGTGTCGR